MSANYSKKMKEILNDTCSDPLTWNISQLILEEPEKVSLPNDPKLKAFKINLRNANEDGTKGRLIFQFERSPSLGISTKYGTSLGLKMYDGTPTERQQKTLDSVNEIVETVRNYIYNNRKEVNKPKLTGLNDSEFKYLNPIKYKEDEETGDRVEGMAPLMNIKFLTGKDKDSREIIRTVFTLEDEYDDKGEPLEVDWNEFVNKGCFATCVIRFDSVFIGEKIVFRIYLVECDLKANQPRGGPKRFLRSNRFATASTVTKVNLNGEDDIVNRLAKQNVDETPESEEEQPESIRNRKPLIASDNEESEEESKPLIKIEPKKKAVMKKK
jgi:hypothetical protein